MPLLLYPRKRFQAIVRGFYFLLMQKSFTLNSNIKAAIDKLPDQDAGKLFKMILDFANGIETKPDSFILDVAFAPIKEYLQEQINKQKIKSDKMKSNGSLGGKAKAKILAKASKSYQLLPIATNEQKNEAPKNNYKKWTVDDFKNDITANQDNYEKEMLKAFYNYWSEKDAYGKMRFQLQKTWETKRRLVTWRRNNENRNTTSSNGYDNKTVAKLPNWNA
jgi:hypothetical protein